MARLAGPVPRQSIAHFHVSVWMAQQVIIDDPNVSGSQHYAERTLIAEPVVDAERAIALAALVPPGVLKLDRTADRYGDLRGQALGKDGAGTPADIEPFT
jgi:hypothetical protein